MLVNFDNKVKSSYILTEDNIKGFLWQIITSLVDSTKRGVAVVLKPGLDQHVDRKKSMFFD